MRPAGNIIGPQVRRFRTARGLSQEAFAAKCQLLGLDISREVLARIEGRVRFVTDAELIVIARALAVELVALFPTSEMKKIARSVRPLSAEKAA
jgi:transcriptional regulator with XRE-family HTH domain